MSPQTTDIVSIELLSGGYVGFIGSDFLCIGRVVETELVGFRVVKEFLEVVLVKIYKELVQNLIEFIVVPFFIFKWDFNAAVVSQLHYEIPPILFEEQLKYKALFRNIHFWDFEDHTNAYVPKGIRHELHGFQGVVGRGGVFLPRKENGIFWRQAKILEVRIQKTHEKF